MTETLASSFADAQDLADYSRSGAYAKGDNGVGCWGDKTAQDHTPMCALPPDDVIAKWGSMKARDARGRMVQVSTNVHTVVCQLADRMPWKKNITNGAGIDLNPAALRALRLKAPILLPCVWTWVD